MSTLAIITWANSQLASNYLDYFQQTKKDVLATFQSHVIPNAWHLTAVKVDLENSLETKQVLFDIFNDKKIEQYSKIIFMHLVWKFFYEGLLMNHDCFHETYKSSVTTFQNVYHPLQQYLLQKLWNSKHPDITLFNIWSISDMHFWEAPWHSYSLVKNILRRTFNHEVFTSMINKKNNVHWLFINAGTIDMDKEQQLRPFADQDYWLSRDELFTQTINELETVKWYLEKTLYRPHPQYEVKYKNETLEQTHQRRLQEMWK
jgi:hypothetical protein